MFQATLQEGDACWKETKKSKHLEANATGSSSENTVQHLFPEITPLTGCNEDKRESLQTCFTHTLATVYSFPSPTGEMLVTVYTFSGFSLFYTISSPLTD
jgi:hypothetical protein